VKNDVMPISSPAFSTSGFEAVKPVAATNPGRIRSAAVNAAPLALRPGLAKDEKTMSAKLRKLFRRKAKKPTWSVLRMSWAMTFSSPRRAQNSPASVMSSATSALVRRQRRQRQGRTCCRWISGGRWWLDRNKQRIALGFSAVYRVDEVLK
jgi:hypothetical protein